MYIFHFKITGFTHNAIINAFLKQSIISKLEISTYNCGLQTSSGIHFSKLFFKSKGRHFNSVDGNVLDKQIEQLLVACMFVFQIKRKI